MTLYLTHPVSVLVADPPWSFDDDLPDAPKAKRGASGHYDCLSVEELKRFPLPTIDRPAVLLMWRVAAMVEEAYAVVRAWGFTPKSEIVWKKVKRKGGRHFGMGHYVRAEHETCIVAGRGPSAQLVKRRDVRSIFEAPIGRHSEKPDAFYELVEALFDGPRAELFGRRKRAGWDVYGNEAAQ